MCVCVFVQQGGGRRLLIGTTFGEEVVGYSRASPLHARAQVENAISTKLVECIWGSSQLVAGFGLAFFKSWRLAVVLIACTPLLGAASYIMFSTGVAGGVAVKSAYSAAGAIAVEALSAMRTVVSFGGEAALSRRYTKHLRKAEVAAIHSGTWTAFGTACLFSVMFTMYGLGFWYGGKLIADSRESAINDYPVRGNWSAAFGPEAAAYASAECLDDYNYIESEEKRKYFDICACDLDWAAAEFPVGNPVANRGNVKCGCGYAYIPARS